MERKDTGEMSESVYPVGTKAMFELMYFYNGIAKRQETISKILDAKTKLMEAYRGRVVNGFFIDEVEVKDRVDGFANGPLSSGLRGYLFAELHGRYV